MEVGMDMTLEGMEWEEGGRVEVCRWWGGG